MKATRGRSSRAVCQWVRSAESGWRSSAPTRMSCTPRSRLAVVAPPDAPQRTYPTIQRAAAVDVVPADAEVAAAVVVGGVPEAEAEAVGNLVAPACIAPTTAALPGATSATTTR